MLATVSDHTSPLERSRTLGFISTVGCIFGLSLTPILVGCLSDIYSFQKAFLFPVTIGFIGCFCILYLES